MKQVLIFSALIALISCKEEKKMEAEAPKATALAYYGDSINIDSSVSVDQTLLALKSSDSLMTTVSGYVTSVCQMKGCWMVLSQNPNDSTGLFVKFRDYGFFVPKDLSGSKVSVYGKAFKEVTSVDELRHYAEDEGKSEEEIAKITAPAEEMKFMANGVAVLEKPMK